LKKIQKWNLNLIPIICLLFLGKMSVAQDSLLYPSLSAGIDAPLFKGKDENGKKILLEKVKSRYTLLYFYEIHCHLCETITPELKKLYTAYHGIGLEIIAVPLEGNQHEWLKYVKAEQLSWKNVFLSANNLKRVKSDYKLTVSPTFYLLDKNRKVLTQRMGRIEQVIDELNLRIR
jgi:thiol-disulfide isomerase/thioredoxin